MLRLRQEDTSLRALHSVAKARGEQQAARIEELQAALVSLLQQVSRDPCCHKLQSHKLPILLVNQCRCEVPLILLQDAVHAATADWRRARVASAVARDGRGMAGDEAAADEGDAEDGKGGGGS